MKCFVRISVIHAYKKQLQTVTVAARRIKKTTRVERLGIITQVCRLSAGDDNHHIEVGDLENLGPTVEVSYLLILVHAL